MQTKDIPGFTGYKINENGEVFSYKGKKTRGHKMATVITNCGYVHVSLVYTKGKSKPFLMHRLVAQTFIPNPENKPQINHIDGNKENNHITNLEWCTSSENRQHAIQTGLHKAVQGEDQWMAKLSNQDAIDAINMLLNGATNDDVASKFNLHARYVSLVRHKKRWAHLWESHFSGMTAQTSNKFVGKFAHIAEAIVHTAYTDTFRSNADIGAEFGCDASMICHIRNNSNRCPKYFKPFILNYL